MAMLEIDGLVRSFDEFSLGPFSLSLEAGCVMGLIGANGAGKTTLFRSLMGTLRLNEGQVLIDGKIADNRTGLWRQKIGYVGDYTPLFEGWSGRKNLQAFARFYPGWSTELAESYAQRLDLDLELKAKSYSTGQRTKLAIILALSHKPKLLLLDEPTAGLDPISREVFMELLFEHAESEQVAMLYATHYVSEIEQIADRLTFVSAGQLIRNEVKEDLAENWRRITFKSEQKLERIPHALQYKVEDLYHELISDESATTIQFLREQNVEAIEASRLSMEKIAVQILRDTSKAISHKGESRG